MKLNQLNKYIWEIPREGEMLVPGRIYGNESIIRHLKEEAKQKPEWNSLDQIKNVACLPGLQKHALALADVHCGYGASIGSVGAFDYDKGVAVFGMVGFDINCLDPDTKVLHEFGYNKKIKDFEETWIKDNIKCLNPISKVKDTWIENFLVLKPKGKVFEITTESGRKVIATEEHPFFTKKGMVELKNLSGDEISIFGFDGVKFENPSGKIIVSEKDIRKIGLRKQAEKQIIDELKKRELLPLRHNNPKLPYIIKIMGYAWGDGSFYFNKDKSTSNINFYGKAEDLEAIKKDIGNVGYKANKVYSRKRKHSIQTSYDLVEFEATEHSIGIRSQSFAILFKAIGLPSGNKTTQDFEIPKWLLNSPKWQKRLFLASFFGAELSSPNTMTDHGYNFNNAVLSMNKKTNYVESGRTFLKQTIEMLHEFGIRSSFVKEREEYKNKNGEISIRLRIQIHNTNKNLIKLWGKIGFEYNKKRSYLGNVAVQYLRIKDKTINERNNIEKKAKAFRKRGLMPSQIFKLLESNYINKRFLKRSWLEGRKTSPRVSFNFQEFNEFLKEKTEGLGETGQVWEKIIEKKEIKNYKENVYDFTVADENHNFIANSFVVSNCGLQTMKTSLTLKDIEPFKEKLAKELFDTVPAGLGRGGKLVLSKDEIDEMLVKGAGFAVEKGFGLKKDLELIEEKGRVDEADSEAVSLKAKQRMFKEVGTLGSGNHYLEVQVVDKVFDEEIARAFGLFEKQVIISVHCGSRGLGHQIGMDYLSKLARATERHGIKVRDKELVCAPIQSEEGQEYLKAVGAGINTAFANREAITHLTRQAFVKALGVDESVVEMLYGVGHNTAKVEKHEVNGVKKKLLVHRKGSTRGFPAGSPDLPKAYEKTGHPVIIGGTMGTASYILTGTEKGMKETFGSSVHGAGRIYSRKKASAEFKGNSIVEELRKKGILIKGHSIKGLAEEAPGAYKNIHEVINVMHDSGINNKVIMMKPTIVIKG